MNQADMVITLLKALQHHREPYPPARLSPFTERAYAEAEATMRRHVDPDMGMAYADPVVRP